MLDKVDDWSARTPRLLAPVVALVIVMATGTRPSIHTEFLGDKRSVMMDKQLMKPCQSPPTCSCTTTEHGHAANC